MIFEWDENKAKINFAKHKVTFEEAKRIISSRKANKKESEQYWKRRSP